MINHQTQGLDAGRGLSDDDFFHTTCHIDLLLKQKIEMGEFVDLDKLLHKDRLAALNGNYTEDSRMEWVQREGGMFLVPARKKSRINGFRKWEQAFRMYASIYCDKCQGITRIHRSPSRPRPSVRPTAVLINIHEHLI